MNKHVVGDTVFHKHNFCLPLSADQICNGFQDLPLFQVFYVQICKGH